MRPMMQSVLTPMTKDKPSGCGCLSGGCAMGIIVLLLLGGALFWGAWSTFNGIKGLTATKARPIPTYNATDAEIRAVIEKTRVFSSDFDAGKEARISLTANEINTLIAHYEPWSALRGKAFAVISGDRISAQTSLPLTQIRAMQNRFFNGEVSMTFIMEKGKPVPGVVTVKAGEVEMPRWTMRYITSKSFVESLGVPSISEGDSIGSNLTVLQIKDGKLVVHAKKGG